MNTRCGSLKPEFQRLRDCLPFERLPHARPASRQDLLLHQTATILRSYQEEIDKLSQAVKRKQAHKQNTNGQHDQVVKTQYPTTPLEAAYSRLFLGSEIARSIFKPDLAFAEINDTYLSSFSACPVAFHHMTSASARYYSFAERSLWPKVTSIVEAVARGHVLRLKTTMVVSSFPDHFLVADSCVYGSFDTERKTGRRILSYLQCICAERRLVPISDLANSVVKSTKTAQSESGKPSGWPWDPKSEPLECELRIVNLELEITSRLASPHPDEVYTVRQVLEKHSFASFPLPVFSTPQLVFPAAAESLPPHETCHNASMGSLSASPSGILDPELFMDAAHDYVEYQQSPVTSSSTGTASPPQAEPSFLPLQRAPLQLDDSLLPDQSYPWMTAPRAHRSTGTTGDFVATLAAFGSLSQTPVGSFPATSSESSSKPPVHPTLPEFELSHFFPQQPSPAPNTCSDRTRNNCNWSPSFLSILTDSHFSSWAHM